MELSSSNIKKFLIFLEIELSYISGRNFPSSKNKKNPPFQPKLKNKPPKKISYTPGKCNFLALRILKIFY